MDLKELFEYFEKYQKNNFCFTNWFNEYKNFAKKCFTKFHEFHSLYFKPFQDKLK